MRSAVMTFAIFWIPGVALSDTIQVPGDYGTIQEAIDASMNGDSILVNPGTFVENIDFKGKAVTLKSVDGPAVTVIDGSKPLDPDFGSTVTFMSSEGPASILDGFTITNGSGTFYFAHTGHFGGGIICDNASPRIINNVITENISVKGSGGGICCYENASPEISGNVISGNSGGTSAGGIACAYNSHPVISNNDIHDNTAVLHNGGGIGCWFDSSPLITHNKIHGNVAYGGNNNWGGGGIFCFDYSDPTVTFNRIHGNIALDFSGGGINCFEFSSPTIMNNIIFDNEAEIGGAISMKDAKPQITNNIIRHNQAEIGGGIDCFFNSKAVIMNNTLYFNAAASKGGGIACRKNSQAVITNTILWNDITSNLGPEIFIGSPVLSSTVTVSYSDVKGGQALVYVEPGSTLNWGTGIIDANPLFANDAMGDFHLLHTSPCRDSGDDSDPNLPATDFEGDPRNVCGTMDMGADEHYEHLYFTGHAAPGGNMQLKFTGMPGDAPVALFIGIGALDPPLPSAWGDWYLQYPWIGPIDLGAIPSPDGILVFPAMLPGTPPGPYSIYLQAIIKDQLTNLCVMDVL